MTTRDEIRWWLTDAFRKGATYVIVVCDTFDHSDYPVRVGAVANFWDLHDSHSGSMQRVVEVYDLSLDLEAQLAEFRAYHCPPRPTPPPASGR